MTHSPKPAILILHPLFLSGSDIRALSLFKPLERHYRLVFLDIPAHGSRRSTPFSNLSQAACQLMDDLTHLEPHTTFVASIGLSLGARLLLELASGDKDRFGVCILDGIPIADNSAARALRRYRIIRGIQLLTLAIPALVAHLIRKDYGADIASRMVTHIRQMNPANLRAIALACARPLPHLSAEQIGRLVFLFGDQEEDYRHLSTLLNQYPTAEVRVQHNFDHIELCANHPHTYAKLIRSIIGEHEPRLQTQSPREPVAN